MQVLQTVLDFASSNQVVLSVASVAILDLVFALKPSWVSNGILHFIYVFATGKKTPPAPVK